MPDPFAGDHAQQARVWETFRAGRPTRVPVPMGCDPRMILLDPADLCQEARPGAKYFSKGVWALQDLNGVT